MLMLYSGITKGDKRLFKYLKKNIKVELELYYDQHNYLIGLE